MAAVRRGPTSAGHSPVLVATQANGGVAATTLLTPATPALNGITVFSQAGALDAGAPGGVVLTNANQLNRIAPWTTLPVSSLVQNGVGGTPVLRRNEGLVVEFY